MTTALSLRLRPMRPSDAKTLADIERVSFQFPWDADDLRASLEWSGNRGIVAEYAGTPAGHCVWADRGSYLEIWTIAAVLTRQGVGAAMVEQVKRAMGPRRKWIRADVRESNLDAQLFLKAMGFRWTATDRRGCRETGEDTYKFVFERGPG